MLSRLFLGNVLVLVGLDLEDGCLFLWGRLVSTIHVIALLLILLSLLLLFLLIEREEVPNPRLLPLGIDVDTLKVLDLDLVALHAIGLVAEIVVVGPVEIFDLVHFDGSGEDVLVQLLLLLVGCTLLGRTLLIIFFLLLLIEVEKLSLLELVLGLTALRFVLL